MYITFAAAKTKEVHRQKLGRQRKVGRKKVQEKFTLVLGILKKLFTFAPRLKRTLGLTVNVGKQKMKKREF